MEEYKVVLPPLNNYAVYSDGRVWSMNSQKFITPYLINSGYHVIRLWANGLENKFLVHRLVAEYWVVNPEPLIRNCVNHIDNNRLNNNYRNLEWVTQQQNLLAARRTGRINDNRLMAITYLETGAYFICRSMREVCELTGAKMDMVRRIAVGLRSDPMFNGWLIELAPEYLCNADFEWDW